MKKHFSHASYLIILLVLSLGILFLANDDLVFAGINPKEINENEADITCLTGCLSNGIGTNQVDGETEDTPTNTITFTPSRTSTKTSTPRPSSTPYPISPTRTPTPYVYRKDYTKTANAIKTSTNLPEETLVIREQTLTAFFMTQTRRYSTGTIESPTQAITETNTATPEATETASDQVLTQISETTPSEDDDFLQTPTQTPTNVTVYTNKSDRYSQSPNQFVQWPIWLIACVFAGIGIVLYIRKKDTI